MGFEHEIQVVIAWADILIMTAGYILVRVIIVVVCTMGIIVIIRRMRHGA